MLEGEQVEFLVEIEAFLRGEYTPFSRKRPASPSSELTSAKKSKEDMEEDKENNTPRRSGCGRGRGRGQGRGRGKTSTARGGETNRRGRGRGASRGRGGRGTRSNGTYVPVCLRATLYYMHLK